MNRSSSFPTVNKQPLPIFCIAACLTVQRGQQKKQVRSPEVTLPSLPCYKASFDLLRRLPRVLARKRSTEFIAALHFCLSEAATPSWRSRQLAAKELSWTTGQTSLFSCWLLNAIGKSSGDEKEYSRVYVWNSAG